MDTTEIDDLKTRYTRQISLPEVGEEGQMRLAGNRVAVIGAGGLGSALLPLLPDFGEAHLSGVAGLEVVYLSRVHCLESYF